MPEFLLFMLDCVLTGLKSAVGLSVLALAFVFVVFVPYALFLEAGDLARKIQRRRKAANLKFP